MLDSIRRRLLLWQISALLLTGLLVSLITYSLVWSAFNRVRDYNLEQIAYSILRHGVDSGSQEDPDDRGRFLSQIWDAEGDLVFASRDDIQLPRLGKGLRIIRQGGEEWHVFTLPSGGLTIQVAHASTDRKAMFTDIVPWLLLPLSILVALLGGLIWVAVGRALAPLEAVRREISRRDVASLHALDTRNLPDEVAPLVEALNALLGRLDEAMSLQRRFLADAAHELRTPLTAIRLQSQIVQAATDTEQRHEALERLREGVDRAAHLVEQLLSMARLAPEARQAAFAPVALDAVARQVVGEFSALAENRGIDLGVGHCDPAWVSGRLDSLRAMLSNLVSNALRYTPAPGRVDVEVTPHADTVELSVTDTGPGIPAAERERVFDRFYRLSTAQEPGSGLGLAIVRKVVELHGGRIHLEDASGHGLRARIILPRATPPDTA